MNSKTKPVEANKGKTETEKINKPSMAKRIGTYLLAGTLMAGVGAKLGCGDDGQPKADAGNPCYTEVLDSGKLECKSRDGTRCDWVLMEVDGGTAPVSDAGVSETGATDGGVAAKEKQKVCAPVAGVDSSVADAGVAGDMAVEAPDCEEKLVPTAEINMSYNVKINGVQCGQESCNGVVSVGETLVMDGASYKVTGIDGKVLVAESGEYLLVATMGEESACIVKKNGVEQGSCMNTLKASVVPVAWSNDDANKKGKTTLTLSTNENFAPGEETKMGTVTEKDGSKSVTLGPYVTVSLKSVKSLEGKAYLSVNVTNTDTSSKCSEPMGMALDEYDSKELCGVHIQNESSSKYNASCTDVKVTLNVEGEGNKPYTDGEVAMINGQKFKVVLQPKINADGSLDIGKTYVNLENVTADKNRDTVLTYNESGKVNGKIVTVVDITVANAGAADAGPARPEWKLPDNGF